MKDFAEAYKAAHAKAREYTGAKRAGWAEPGKRTRENHAILIPRKEAVDTANNLATAIYAKESCKQKSIAEIKKSRKNCATEKGHDKTSWRKSFASRDKASI